MDHRLLPTMEALESTKSRDWVWGFYQNRRGVRGVWILFRFAGQFHKISIHNFQRLPEPDELREAIWGIKRLDADCIRIYQTARRVPGFSTTAWSTIPSLGSTLHAIMISRSHEFNAHV